MTDRACLLFRYFRSCVPLSVVFVCAVVPSGVVLADASKAPPTAGVSTSLASARARVTVPGEQSSVGGTQSINSKLGAASNDSLLKKGSSQRARGGAASVVVQSNLVREAKKTERALSIGVSRSESLADGAVRAPGLADFAEFFRASNQQPGGQSPDARGLNLGGKGDSYLKAQAEADKLRTQTIDSIKKILKTNPPKEQKLNLMLRLAELHVERHAYFLELEIQTFNRAHDQWLKDGKGPQPQFSTNSSKAEILAGAAVLRSAAKEFPAHQKTPEILFNLGFLLNQLESDSARIYFEQLVKNFPKSEFVPDTYLSLGEFYFQKNDFINAQKMYQATLKYKGTDAYNYAVYKLGWTFFNLPGRNAAEHRESLKKSLAAFQLVVKLSDAPEASVILKGLRREALKDMVLVYVDLKDIAAAEQFYASLGERDLYFTFLERLAWQATEAGELDSAIAIYRKLVQEAPTLVRMPELLAKVAEIHDKRNDPENVLNTLKFMSKTLAKGSDWERVHASNKKAMTERDETLAKTLEYWSKTLHAQAQKTKRREYFDLALQAYAVHIENYGETPQSFDSYFYSGEILVFKEDFEGAAGMYARAVQMDEKFKLGNKLTRDALLNAIASLDLALDKKELPKLPEAGKATSKIPLTNLHGKLIWVFDAFERLYPADSETPKLVHRAARIQYAFGDYDASLERWIRLARKDPSSEEAADGIRMALRVYVNRSDWENARKIGQGFLSINGLADAYISRDIISVMKVALFQLAIQREGEQKHDQAEELFVQYQKEYPDDNDAPKALYNAANNAFKNARMDGAITHLKTLLSMYQKSELVPDSLFLIASCYDGLGQFDEAAQFYTQLYRGHSSHKYAERGAFRAIQLYAVLEQHADTERVASEFIARFVKSRDLPDAWRLLGESFVARGQFKQALDAYDDAARRFSSGQGHWSVYFYAQSAAANEQSGKASARNKAIALGLRTYEKLTPESRGESAAIDGLAVLAQLRVQDVEADFESVMKKKVTDGLKLTDEFTAIREEVEKVAAKYVEVVKLGNAEAGIQSLYRVAQMQEFLAKILLNAPVPKGASAAETEQFKGTLERIALPLQEEALNLYLTAWQRAQETEAITPFAAEIYSKLVVLRPAEYVRSEGVLPTSSYYAARLSITKETRNVLK
jgi:TolA-binding protein